MKIKDDSLPLYAPVATVDDTQFDPQTASASFVISTTSRDRDGDVMISEGCRLNNYRRNPVVLFDHGEVVKLPIGLSETPDTKQCTVQIEDDRITGRVYFHQRTIESSQIADLTAHNILRAASVGYKGLDADPIDPRQPKSGMIFNEWEMVEWSVVVIPANQDALRQACLGRWDGKKLCEPLMVKFKSLLVPSTKVVIPMANSRFVKRKETKSTSAKNKAKVKTKAVSDEMPDDQTQEETKSDLPQSAELAKACLEAHKALNDMVAEKADQIEHPQMQKAFKSYLGKSFKSYGVLAKAAAEHHPDHFDPYEDPEEDDEDEEKEEKPEDEQDKGDETDEDQEAKDKDEDISNVGDDGDMTDKDEEPEEEKTKSFKGGSPEDFESHTNSIKDATELLDDMSKSANIPSGYKRQCKGVMPGLMGVSSFLSKALGDEDEADVEREEEVKNEDTDHDGDTDHDDDADEKAAAAILKRLNNIEKQQSKNALVLKTLGRASR